MLHAPVMIPTCNRIKHLKRCISSLKLCEGAIDTELYISVDYPPNERYQEGYDEVVNYVIKGIQGFKEVHYFIQSSNLGEAKNILFLKNVIAQKFETYIFCEDDITFSPCALLFFNTGLEKYREREDIVFLCTSGGDKRDIQQKIKKKEEDNLEESTVFLYPWFSAWGYATWISKYNKLTDQVNIYFFENLTHNYKKLGQLYCYSYYLFKTVFLTYLRMHPTYVYSNGEPKHIDFQLTIYMIYNNLFSVRSIEPLSLNWGLDGTGINSGYDINYHPEKCIIYQGIQYDYVMLNCGVPVTRERHTLAQWCDALLNFLKLLLVRLVGEKLYFSICKRDMKVFDLPPEKY